MLSRTLGTTSFGSVSRTFATRFLLAILVVLAACLSSWSQSTAGRVLGTVSDQSGAAVAGATVVVTDLQRGTSRSITTGENGTYVAPDLQPGTYKIHVESKGFKSTERPNVLVEVATDVRSDFTLQPGLVSQTVVVTEEVPLLNTTSATLGGTLSNKEINDLPLNGRNYENLLQLRPGVMRYPGGGFSTTSTNGLRAEDNAYLVDGLFNSEPFSGQGIINGAGIAGDSATILPIDSIQEFNVQENAPAEYGWKPGAIVNVGLKAGTNSVHGTAFAFGRDGAMDARNFFNTSPNPKLPRTLEQYGGSLGGPIIKDKAFFFGAYEGQRYNVGNSFGGITSPSMVSMPDAANCVFGAPGDCANSIPDVITDLQAGGITISPASLQVSSGRDVPCPVPRLHVTARAFPSTAIRASTFPTALTTTCMWTTWWRRSITTSTSETTSTACSFSETIRERLKTSRNFSTNGSPTFIPAPKWWGEAGSGRRARNGSMKLARATTGCINRPFLGIWAHRHPVTA